MKKNSLMPLGITYFFSLFMFTNALSVGTFKTNTGTKTPRLLFYIPKEKMTVKSLLWIHFHTVLSESLAFQVHPAQWFWPLSYPPGSTGK